MVQIKMLCNLRKLVLVKYGFNNINNSRTGISRLYFFHVVMFSSTILIFPKLMIHQTLRSLVLMSRYWMCFARVHQPILWSAFTEEHTTFENPTNFSKSEETNLTQVLPGFVCFCFCLFRWNGEDLTTLYISIRQSCINETLHGNTSRY